MSLSVHISLIRMKHTRCRCGSHRYDIWLVHVHIPTVSISTTPRLIPASTITTLHDFTDDVTRVTSWCGDHVTSMMTSCGWWRHVDDDVTICHDDVMWWMITWWSPFHHHIRRIVYVSEVASLLVPRRDVSRMTSSDSQLLKNKSIKYPVVDTNVYEGQTADKIFAEHSDVINSDMSRCEDVQRRCG